MCLLRGESGPKNRSGFTMQLMGLRKDQQNAEKSKLTNTA